ERIFSGAPLHLYKLNRCRVVHFCWDGCLCFFYYGVRLVIALSGLRSLRLHFCDVGFLICYSVRLVIWLSGRRRIRLWRDVGLRIVVEAISLPAASKVLFLRSDGLLRFCYGRWL